MMACAGHNTDMFAPSLFLSELSLNPLQRLRPSGQLDWDLLSNKGRLYEPSG